MTTYIARNSNNQLQEYTPAAVGGSANANAIPALNSSGVFDSSMLPPGTGTVDSVTVTASVALSAGNMVNLYDNSGTLGAKLADCSTGLKAHGYVTAAVASGASATVYLNDQNTALTGLTPGSDYYLSTAGSVSASAPTTSGYLLQKLGVALSATSLQFSPEQPIIIA